MFSIRKFAGKGLVAGALVFAMGSASANLIENGGFEDPVIDSGTWQYFVSGDVAGWDGSNIEIWNDFNGVSAYEGDQFAELNAHPYTGSAFSIFQDLNTVAGQWYELSFAYRARSNDSEAFEVTAADVSWVINDHTTDNWSVFYNVFQATSGTSRVEFTTLIPDTGTVGNFLDDVVVTAKSVAVPAPGTLALLGLGLAGLGISRRRRN